MLQEEFKIIEETADHIRSYVGTRIDKAKLDAAEKASDIASLLLAKMMVAFVFFFFAIFLSDAAAYWIGERLGRVWEGFLLVAGFYLVLSVIIWLGREQLLRIPIMNAIIRQLFHNKNIAHEKD